MKGRLWFAPNVVYVSTIVPVYVASYNHTMQPLRRKCIYKRSDNFNVILNQFLYGGKRVVPDDIMETIRDEIHNETNILYPSEIPLTIPILECILKRNELSTYKDSIYFIYFKLSGGSFPHITTKEYNTILNTFNVISSIYDKYKPNDRKSFLNYSFVLKKLLIMLGKVEYAKYIPQLKTHSKQKELERVWELITKDREWAVALRKRKIDKIKQDGRVMVRDEKSAEKLYNRLYLVESEGTYKVAFENDSKTYKDILSPTNR